MGIFDYILPANFEFFLSIEQEYDSRISPKSLIKELENKSTFKKFINRVNKHTSDPHKVVRRLHVCNLILLYSDIFADGLASQVKVPFSDDKWLNDEFIRPYLQFIHKCSNEYELYAQCKKSLIKENQIFDQLFFIINLLKTLFKCTQKISLIGKFYKPKNKIVWQGVIDMISIQAKQLYFTFKNILTIILQNSQRFLFTTELQQIMKNILIEDLAIINEEMKILMLGKQFYPYGKSIGIKLFRIDQTTDELDDTIRGIVTDHCETNRRMEKQLIEDKLFNDKNGFNVKFFEETMKGCQSEPIFRVMGKKKNLFKPASQEVVISEEDDPEQNLKKLAETNESNMNKVDNM